MLIALCCCFKLYSLRTVTFGPGYLLSLRVLSSLELLLPETQPERHAFFLGTDHDLIISSLTPDLNSLDFITHWHLSITFQLLPGADVVGNVNYISRLESDTAE